MNRSLSLKGVNVEDVNIVELLVKNITNIRSIDAMLKREGERERERER